MSVEDARTTLRAETVQVGIKGVMLQSWYDALDRLILEVQAEAIIHAASIVNACNAAEAAQGDTWDDEDEAPISPEERARIASFGFSELR